jgi:diguanylate cyclase (GGDEF)-like protein
MLPGTYNYPLAFVSLFIAILASYTTLDLTNRISKLNDGFRRVLWLTGGAMSMGLGIWSMHFVGMLSFSLPIPLGYDLKITFYSLVIAIFVSYFALDLVTRNQLTSVKLASGGLLMGAGISAMHYTGMAAMQMDPQIQYNWPIFLLSLLIAAGASIAALWLAFTLRLGQYRFMWLRRATASILMGIAIAGMHYTGMAAANFPMGAICRAASAIDTHFMMITVVVSTMSILIITLGFSLFDARLEARTSGLNESLRQANEQLRHQATHDALTGLPNRAYMNERLQQAIAASKQSKKGFAIYFIDLDGFKSINDSLGHNAGDEVLKELAQRLRKVIRKNDFIARLGGDEFVVIVENLSDGEIPGRIAEDLFTCFREAFQISQTCLDLSPSIGISLYPDHAETGNELLAHADTAMYEAKSRGRNNYQFFEPLLSTATRRNWEIQRCLSAAIMHGQFYLQFQPKCDCYGVLQGAEALLRWRHPDLGFISPAEFIPIAEKSGHIMQIGRWVIEEVAKQINEWEAHGKSVPQIAVNLSPLQLHAPHLVDEIIEITNRYNVAPKKIMFEITESAAMQNMQCAMNVISRLNKAGFDFAIDDFGTGHSSLSYLHQITLQELKLDRMYVAKLDSADPKVLAVISAIIDLAHALDMKVVAEGVENESQLASLRMMKCDRIQGFLFARPLEKEIFSDLLIPQEQKEFIS